MTAVHATIGIGLIMAPLLAFAANPLGAAIQGSPFQRFTDADYDLFFDNAQQAATGPLGEVRQWSNDKSGAHGTVKAVRSYQRDDADCRELRGENYARGRTESFRLAICKQADGKWRLAPSESSPKPSAPAAPPPPAAAQPSA